MSVFTQKIRTACLSVAAQARSIQIIPEQLQRYAREFPVQECYQAEWNDQWHYHGQDNEATATYILALDSINFGSGYFVNLKKRQDLSGYMTVAQALKEAFEKKPLLAQDLMTITPVECADMFDQDMNNSDMLELMEHFSCALQEIGTHIVTAYQGSFVNFIKSADKSVVKLAEQLSILPHYADVADYHGQMVPIYKRAQIAAADVYYGFKGTGLGAFDDLKELTIFADNAIPHVLRIEGVFKYSKDLEKRIDCQELLESGSEEEVELRACSIHAVEEILKEIHKLGHKHVTIMDIDKYLWDHSHDSKYLSKPKHRTKTSFY